MRLRDIGSWLLGGLTAGLLANCGGNYTQSLGDAPGGSSGKSSSSGGAGNSSGGAGNSSGGYNPTGGIHCPVAGCNSDGSPASPEPEPEPGPIQTASHVCETQCALQILQVKPTGCKICHDSGVNQTLKSAGLDLVSFGVTARLKDVPSKHTDITTMSFNAATDCPVGDRLIDSRDVERSWMLKKIRAEQGKCGDRDPSTMALSAADQTCLENYIFCVAGS